MPDYRPEREGAAQGRTAGRGGRQASTPRPEQARKARDERPDPKQIRSHCCAMIYIYRKVAQCHCSHFGQARSDVDEVEAAAASSEEVDLALG